MWTSPGFDDTLIYPRSDGVWFLESFRRKEDSDAPQVPHRGSQPGDRASSIRHESCPARRDLRHERSHDLWLAEAGEDRPRRGWRQRRRELAGALEREASCRDALARNIARAERNGPLTDTATRENTVAGQVLAERRELAVIAARLAPPAYITKELGERPTDPEKRRSWEAGVRTIEGYRQEHGVKDRDHAFGQDTSRSAARAREQAQQRLRQSRRELGRIKEATRTRDMDFSLGIGR